MAYGGSHDRGPIRAVATGLHHSHSHSNTGSEPRLGPTPQLRATLRFINHCTTSGTPYVLHFHVIIIIIFFFFVCTGGMRKFPCQGSSLCHSSDWSHFSDITGSLTGCTTRGLQDFYVIDGILGSTKVLKFNIIFLLLLVLLMSYLKKSLGVPVCLSGNEPY